MRVTGKNIATLPAGRHSAGPSLTLLVKATGRRTWVQRVTVDGRRRDIGLGPAALVTLKEARAAALENRRDVYRGGDPTTARRKARTIPTFAQAVAATFAAHAGRWRSAKTAQGWRSQLETHAIPELGALPVDKIDRADVLRVLEPIWTAKPALAVKLRTRVRAVLAWAQAHGHVSQNIVDLVGGALPAQPAVKAHHAALPYKDIPAALLAVEGCGAPLPAKACLTFAVLTACRSTEARLATWAEVDVEAREWRVPASRMKSNREHRVPLCDATLAILDTVRPLRVVGGLVFPSVSHPGRPMALVALSRTLKASGLGDRATVHGMRSAFRDWCADTGQPREVAEAALAHVVGGVEGAYMRSDLLDRRRELMTAWAAYAAPTTTTTTGNERRAPRVVLARIMREGVVLGETQEPPCGTNVVSTSV